MSNRIGQQLGNYLLAALLERGGFAEVYLRQHVRFKQQAAIKVLNAHLSGQEAAHFQQELATPDPGARQGIFDQIHQIYLTDLPFNVLFGRQEIAMVRKGTHNYQPSPLNGDTINIWEWWCDHGKC